MDEKVGILHPLGNALVGEERAQIIVGEKIGQVLRRNTPCIRFLFHAHFGHRGVGQLFADMLFGLQHLGVQHGERRYLRVPFQQGGDAARELVRQAIKFPHRVNDVVVVRVNQVRLAIRMSREMELNNSLVRHVANKLFGIVVVVHTGDVNVVHIEQQAAIRLSSHPRNELPLAQSGTREADIRARILKDKGPL